MITNVDQDLPCTSPEQQGIASSVILEFVEAVEEQIHELHSFMLLRHGYVVAEGWWSPYEDKLPHMMFSLSKSFTSTAVGLAVSEGYFSIDDTVLSFFPNETPDHVSDFLARMRVRHLLSMSTGHVDDTFPIMTGNDDQTWTKSFLDMPVDHEPGTHFLYNTGATYMLSAIVQKTTGEKITDYLKPRLFDPLGIKNPRWEESPQGIPLGGTGLNITTEDIARLGQLYLQKGMWKDQRLIPSAWIEEATRFQVSNGQEPESDWAQGYGYQFWRCRHNIYRGDGAFGQYCIVMPEHDAILAITSGVGDMQAPLNLIWDILLPAMGTEPQIEDADAYNRLTEKLSSLTITPVQGQATSAISTEISGKSYSFDSNEMNLEGMTLDFDETGCILTVKTTQAEETIPCGYNTWREGSTTLFNAAHITRPAITAASCAWTADDCLTVIVRLHETPFYHNFVCHFDGNELVIDTWINVSFAPSQKLQLTGKY